jgi:hypothetical protein
MSGDGKSVPTFSPPAPTPIIGVGAVNEKEWFFLGWGLLALGLGFRAIVAPEKTIRSRDRWADHWIRWLSFGRVKKSFGPFMSEEMDIRITFVGGIVVSIAGAAALFFVLIE